MAMFRYEAVDSTGKILHGVMQAADQTDLAIKLQARGFALRNAFNASGAPISAGNAAAQQQPGVRPWSIVPTGLQKVFCSSGVPVSVKSLVSARQLALFLRQLATMVRAGMPLAQSLRENLPYVRNARLKKAVSQISDKIEAGGRLSDAMAQFPDIFASHIIGCVVCGELGGDLDIFLDDMAADYEREARDVIKGMIGWFFAKSSIISGIIAVFISYRVLDPLLTLFKSGNSGNMTFQTVISAVFGRLLHVGLPVTIITVTVFTAIWYTWGAIKRIPEVRYTLDRMRKRIPPWGTLHKNRSIVSFLTSLDRLLRAGVDVSRAWEASSLVCRDNSVGIALAIANTRPGENVGITERFTRCGVLKVEEIGLINSGERAGKLPETLDNLATSYKSAENPLVITGTIFSISAVTTLMIIVAGLPMIAIASSWNDFMQYFLNGMDEGLVLFR